MSLQPRGNPLRDASNSNRENQRPKQQSLKGPGNNKRSALGNVTNNANVRKQPVRAAKDKHSLIPGTSKSGYRDQENEIPIEGKKATFSVFEDRVPSTSCEVPVSKPEPTENAKMEVEDKENIFDTQPQPILNDAVIGLNRNHSRSQPVIGPLHNLEDIASPMVVDGEEECIEPEPEVVQSRDEYGLHAYIPDIYAYMRAKEGEFRLSRDYMNRQVDVTKSMRNILVDWLVEVGEEYKLHRETLFLAINFIDRFLSLVGVQRPKLQLVGAACMFIAAKYEEIYPPEVGEFVYITDDTYSKSQVLKMESVILKLLDFKVAAPTVNWFCEHFLASLRETDETTQNLAFYLAELCLVENEEFLGFNASVIAASCVLLARSSLGVRSAWPASLERTSGYSIQDLISCVRALYSLYTKTSSMPQQAVTEKYKQEKFGHVALLQPPDVLAIQ